jgi:hypothetical protein
LTTLRKPGDQLPTVKEVVGSLAINPNTVLKAPGSTMTTWRRSLPTAAPNLNNAWMLSEGRATGSATRFRTRSAFAAWWMHERASRATGAATRRERSR